MTRTRHILALAAALIVVGGLLVPTTGLAQDDEDEEADEERRTIEIETEGNAVTIELERETEPREDKVEMTWEPEEATFGLEHESENQTRETESKLEAVFGAVAEYRDENDDGSYDPGEEIVSAWALGDEDAAEEVPTDGQADWGVPSIDNVTRDGKQGKQITSTASLGEGGQATLRFLVFGDFVNLDETDLRPTGAKIDVVVADYAYQAEGTDIGLFLETETETSFEREIEEDDETGVAATGGSAGSDLVFTWKDTAQVDGQTRDVSTTVLEQEGETEQEDGEASSERERSFVLGYPRGEEIVHDPKAEVLVQSTAASTVPAPALAALVGLVAAAALVGRRG